MTSSNTRIRRQQKTRQSILDAARQILSREGSESLSMREIARMIDYSPAGLYEYFDSKEAIVDALCAEGHQRLADAMRQVDETLPPAEYLLEIGLAYIDFALRNPDYYLLMFTRPPAKSQLDEMMGENSSFPILLGAIRHGIESGVFRTRPGFELYEMAYTAWSIVHGIAMLRLTYLDEFPLDFASVDREALLAFSRGLQTG
jgi:AcrR family transcriptional regulator